MSLKQYDNFEQGTPAWFEARCGIVTASIIGSLITPTLKVANNDTSRSLVRQLATERITGHPDVLYPNRDMQRGTELEPYARAIYEEHFAPVTELGFMRLDEEWGSIGFSPDGLVGEDGLIEIKSPRPKNHVATILADKVPAQYMAQCQTGLLVSGRKWLDFISFSPGARLYVTRVLPDERWAAVLREAAQKAEAEIADVLASYESVAAARSLPATEWFDPFGEEEMVF